MNKHWRSLLPRGAEFVLGLDEVGYGALAGPIVVSVVAVPVEWSLFGLRDSKKLSPGKREALDRDLTDHVVLEAYLPAKEIDRRGAYEALRFLHESAIEEALAIFPGCPVIVDGTQKIRGAITLAKADDIVPAVMADSVHAKVFRDKWMGEALHERYPVYQFDQNKGYGTKAHYQALFRHGICDEHRRTFLKFEDGAVVPPEKVAAQWAQENEENPPKLPQVPERTGQ
jgi:ribonuclease HII